MKIQSVKITRSYHKKDTFECTVGIDSDYGAMQLKIPDERIQQVVDLIADLIVQSSKDVADNLSRQAMERTAIEHQP